MQTVTADTASKLPTDAQVLGAVNRLSTRNTTVVCAAAFWFLSWRGLANIVRFVPFPVMAGFLAASGWLLANGAMTVIVGTPLTVENAVRLSLNAWQPLCAALAVAAVLFALSRRLPGSVLMPVVIAVTTLIVHGGESGEFWRSRPGAIYLEPDDLARRLACFHQHQFAELAGAGHMVHFDRPRDLVTTIRQFLEAAR